jgi:hypothetical protein
LERIIKSHIVCAAGGIRREHRKHAALRHLQQADEICGEDSLPPEIIYQCELCRTEIWIGNRLPPPGIVEQPQAQQQQQPQPEEKE